MMKFNFFWGGWGREEKFRLIRSITRLKVNLNLSMVYLRQLRALVDVETEKRVERNASLVNDILTVKGNETHGFQLFLWLDKSWFFWRDKLTTNMHDIIDSQTIKFLVSALAVLPILTKLITRRPSG